MDIGNNIKSLRQSHKLTLREVGQRCGVSPQAVYKWEQGINEPNMRTTQILCDLFGCTVEELAGYYTQPLTRMERDIVVAYRSASDEVKGIVETILRVGR